MDGTFLSMTSAQRIATCGDSTRAVETGGWWLRAACRSEPTCLFFPADDAASAPARRICARCPVREPCLTHALASQELGIWGGTTATERRYMSTSRPRRDLGA